MHRKSVSSKDSTLVAEALRRTRAFKKWPASLLFTLASSARVTRYPPGAHVLGDGEEAGVTWAVFSGRILLVRTLLESSNGDALGLLEPSMLYCEWMTGRNGNLSPTFGLTLDATTIVHVDSRALQDILDGDLSTWGDLTMMLLEQENMLFTGLVGQFTGTLLQRIAHTILQSAMLRVSCATPEKSLELKISQEELSDLLQLSRKTVGKELKRLESMGLISMRYNKISVPNISELSLFAGAAFQ